MKKILSILCMLTVIFSMTTLVANANAETKNYYGYTADDLKSNSESLYTSLSSFSDEEIKTYMESQDLVTSNAVKSWADIKDEVGEFVSIEDFQVEEAKNVITTRLLVNHSKRDVIFTVSYGENLAVTSILAEKEYSLGEKMGKAGLNTIMGMGTVFIILILISFLISLFKYINVWEENRKKRQDSNEEIAVVKPEAKTVVHKEEDIDDLELVAVISAAIAASANVSTDDFVVRSIKRR